MFDKPRSTVLYSSDQTLLSGVIADDGQWRFPMRDSLPEKFRIALLTYEDKHFYEHNGVYLPSLFRAVSQNLREQRVVSGASTLTMQTVRLSRDNPSRTITEKLTEMIRALRLEWRYDKDEILALYASNAPFGGNVVGLDAASWRYFGRSPEQLSWAESTTLAVLPNAPSLIFPGKNQERLLEKRNHVLKLLYEEGHMDEQTLALSLSEPLPGKPYPLPQTAPHLLQTLIATKGKGKQYNTTIQVQLQQQCHVLLNQRVAQLESNFIHNAAVLVVDVHTGDVVAYVGNSTDLQNRYGNMVDVIPAPRSTGSILKPFLYAAMLKDGLILPNSLVADIPIQYDGFSPQNYAETFDGAVPASHALSRSLNIPSVIMLKEYGYQRFYHLLQKIGFSHFTQPADHYGLSIILGGGESSLWDITHAYAGMSRTLNEYHDSNGQYFDHAYGEQNILQHEAPLMQADQFPPFDAASIWCTYKALLEVNRPETELGWEVYNSASPIAWKTGTSFGNRDAWAVGTTPDYVVGVWVGNADGQGRPTLTGVTSAAPLLFDIFSLLPHTRWFNPPFDNLRKIAVCKESGMRYGEFCEHADSIWVPTAGLNAAACSFHRKIFTDEHGGARLSVECAQGRKMVAKSWFVLPPVQEYYYKSRHPEYLDLPAYAEGCGDDESLPIGLIYPKGDAKIFVPRDLDGHYEKVVLQATHRDAQATLFWHLDGDYLGETKSIHHLEIHPEPGKHLLTITDINGQSLFRYIEFIGKNNP
ncbi:MAG: penicillin-binding protein 1C [Flavobacteriales bacterium]|nr:penicillin-binding protein 1C [Flavobacteriales bacterium]